jgi:hypothetical protein
MERSGDRGGGDIGDITADGRPPAVDVPEYRLTPEDACHAFLVLARLPGDGLLRRMIEGVPFSSAIVFFIDYCYLSRDPRSLALSIVGAAAYLIMYSRPRLQARRAAREAEGSGELGRMAVRGIDGDRILLAGGVSVPMSGHSQACAIETRKTFIFQPDGSRVLLLPKRVLDRTDIMALQFILNVMDYADQIRYFR